MKTKLSFKIVAIILVVFMFAATIVVGLSGYSLTDDPIIPEISSRDDSSLPSTQKVSLLITSPDGSELTSGEITVVNTSALDATKEYLSKNEISFETNESTFTAISDVTNTETEGWVLYIDGSKSAVNPSTLILKEGSQIEWKWEELTSSSAPSSETSPESTEVSTAS